MRPRWYLAPASRIDSRRRRGRHSGQATWPWSHAAQMQTSRIAAHAAEETSLPDRSPDPVPVTFLDTGAASSDGPPRSVASITAMTRKARGGHPGPSPCQRYPRATRSRQPVQENGPSTRAPTTACSSAPATAQARGSAPTLSPRYATAPRQPPSPPSRSRSRRASGVESPSRRGCRQIALVVRRDRSPAWLARLCRTAPRLRQRGWAVVAWRA